MEGFTLKATATPVEGNRIVRYGWRWRPLERMLGVDPRFLSGIPAHIQDAWYSLAIELAMCRFARQPEKLKTLCEQGMDHLGFEEHIKRVVTIIWGQPGIPDEWRWEWNPYQDVMFHDACTYQFLSLAGHASAAKSRFMAGWGMANFLINPTNTKVFFTSTTLTDSRGRIWGVAENFWEILCKFFLNKSELIPGNLVSSQGKIQAQTENKRTDLFGLVLVPGQKGAEDVARMIGFKADHMILLGDEFPLLSDKLVEAAEGNLSANKHLQMIVGGNMANPNDPMGKFSEPVGGWGTVKENGEGMEEDANGMRGWKTARGWCRWFDGLRCPNVVAGYEKWKGLLRLETVEGWKKSMAAGLMSVYEYWRQCRSFLSPEGKTNAVFTPQEISAAGAEMRVNDDPDTNWISQPAVISFCDASFTHDGDSAIGLFAFVGQAHNRRTGVTQTTVSIHDGEVLNANLDRSIDQITGKERDPIPQIAARYAFEIRRRGIQTKCAGLDDSGGGASFGSMLAGGYQIASMLSSFEGIGPDICRVAGNGEIPDVPVSAADPTPANERYDRLVSFLWFQCKEYVRSGQLKGIPAQAIKEFCTRTFEPTGRGMVKIQPKKEMKTSPNWADAVAGILEVARRNFDLTVTSTAVANEDDSFLAFAREMQSIRTP